MSSEIVTKRYQKCEICKKEYQLLKKDSCLNTIKLPFKYLCESINDKTTINEISVCDSCVRKVRDCLTKELILEDIEWGGLVIRWKEEQ